MGSRWSLSSRTLPPRTLRMSGSCGGVFTALILPCRDEAAARTWSWHEVCGLVSTPEGAGVTPIGHNGPVSVLVQLKPHVTQLRGCRDCSEMIGPVVTGEPVVSPVVLI